MTGCSSSASGSNDTLLSSKGRRLKGFNHLQRISSPQEHSTSVLNAPTEAPSSVSTAHSYTNKRSLSTTNTEIASNNASPPRLYQGSVLSYDVYRSRWRVPQAAFTFQTQGFLHQEHSEAALRSVEVFFCRIRSEVTGTKRATGSAKRESAIGWPRGEEA
jgi:hypothetical protein